MTGPKFKVPSYRHLSAGTDCRVLDILLDVVIVLGCHELSFLVGQEGNSQYIYTAESSSVVTLALLHQELMETC